MAAALTPIAAAMSITAGLNMVVGIPEENHDTDIDSETMRGELCNDRR